MDGFATLLTDMLLRALSTRRKNFSLDHYRGVPLLLHCQELYSGMSS